MGMGRAMLTSVSMPGADRAGAGCAWWGVLVQVEAVLLGVRVGLGAWGGLECAV
jgi:hypothetical protein